MIHLWSRLCLRWSQIVFQGNYERITPAIRTMRLLEEALELAQAEGVSREHAAVILNQVYNKDRGEPYHELGGVLICMAAYAGTRGYDIEDCFLTEFERIMHPDIMEKVRNRNLYGDKIGLKVQD